MIKTLKVFIIFFAICIGLYPFSYFLFDMSSAFFSTKGAIKYDLLWKTAFYIHITSGAIALLTGWWQFSKNGRARHVQIHRLLGKVYIISILFFGAPSGLYLALFANGGPVNSLGFGILALLWFYTAFTAYNYIRKGQIEKHKNWMTRSYALTFAAVTLRLWMPVFIAGFQWEADFAYMIVAWCCWVPNLIVGEIIIRSGTGSN